MQKNLLLSLVSTFVVGLLGGCAEHDTAPPATHTVTTTTEEAPSALVPSSSTTTTVVEHPAAN